MGGRNARLSASARRRAKDPRARIKLLEDRDGDGRYETVHVFAEGLLFANGIQPWQGGVIATVSGQILFLKDRDGDGRADQQDTWYTGFKEENPQLRGQPSAFRPGQLISTRPTACAVARPSNCAGRKTRPFRS